MPKELIMSKPKLIKCKRITSAVCGDRNETVNHISECSKLATKGIQKKKKKKVGKLIHWELCKRLKFGGVLVA